MRRRSLARSMTYLTATRLALNTAYRLVYPFLPAISRGLGVSLERAGLLLTTRSLAGMGTPLLVATVGRGERRSRVIAAALGLFTAAMVLAGGAPGYGTAIAGFALMGVAKPLFDVAAQAYIADRTPYRRRARNLAILELTWAGSLLMGAPAAGWLIGRHGWRAPFWVIGGLSLVALVAVPFAVDRDSPGQRQAAGRLRLDRSAAALLTMGFLYSISAETTTVVFGAWLEDAFALSLVALGGAATVVALAEIAGEGGTLLFTDRIGKKRSVALGLGISTAAYALLAFLWASLGWGLAFLALALFGFELAIVATIPLASEVVPGARARYLSLLVVALYAGRAAGAAIGPVVFERAGLPWNAGLSACLAVAALTVLGVLVREDGNEPGEAPG